MYKLSKYLNFNWYYKLIKKTVTDNWPSTVLICCKTVVKVWHLPVTHPSKHSKFAIEFLITFREWFFCKDLKHSLENISGPVTI